MCDGLRQKALRRTEWAGEHFQPKGEILLQICCRSNESDRRSNFWLWFAAARGAVSAWTVLVRCPSSARSPATSQGFSSLKRARSDTVPPPLSTIGNRNWGEHERH